VDDTEVVKVLTSDGFDCTIVINTMITIDTQFGPVTITQITLMGPIISPDGTMCDFAGTSAEVVTTNAGTLTVEIDSGKATLSPDGQMLSLSDIGVVNPAPPPDIVIITGFSCTCESVDPIDQGARTEDAQRILREKMEELGIE